MKQVEESWQGFTELVDATKMKETQTLGEVEQAPGAQAFARGYSRRPRTGGAAGCGQAQCEGRALWVSPAGVEALRVQGLAALARTVG